MAAARIARPAASVRKLSADPLPKRRISPDLADLVSAAGVKIPTAWSECAQRDDTDRRPELTATEWNYGGMIYFYCSGMKIAVRV